MLLRSWLLKNWKELYRNIYGIDEVFPISTTKNFSFYTVDQLFKPKNLQGCNYFRRTPLYPQSLRLRRSPSLIESALYDGAGKHYAKVGVKVAVTLIRSIRQDHPRQYIYDNASGKITNQSTTPQLKNSSDSNEC